MSRRYALSDDHWAIVESLLPPRPRLGRPRLDDRVILDGILWVLHTGAPWRDLPSRFGNWKTVYSRFNLWTREGVWEQVLQALNESLRESERLSRSWFLDATNVRATRAASGGGPRGALANPAITPSGGVAGD